MNKLDEILDDLQEYVSDDMIGVSIPANMRLLGRAVRQLGVERGAFQALFEAVDNDYKIVQTHAPEVYGAFLVVTNTAEADPDVLNLIAPDQANRVEDKE